MNVTMTVTTEKRFFIVVVVVVVLFFFGAVKVYIVLKVALHKTGDKTTLCFVSKCIPYEMHL